MARRPVFAALAGWSLVAGLVAMLVLRLAWSATHLDALRPVGGGDAAPPFTLPLLGGGEFRSNGDPPAVTVIDFWATWCGPCRQALPRVDELYRKVRDQGVRVVAVNIEDDDVRPEIEKLVREANLQLPVALRGEPIAAAFHVDTLPHLVVVDKSGRIRRVLLGVHSVDELLAAVEEAKK
jgi:thiol-disulfide isomerase/thioredoxin